MRCGSQDRQSGSLSSFTCNFSSNPNLQNVTAARIHTISFPNSQVNVPSYRTDFAVASEDGNGQPEFRSTRAIGPGSVFNLTVFTGIQTFISAPIYIAFPAGVRMSTIAAFLTATIQTESPLGNLIVTWNNFTKRFGIAFDIGVTIKFDVMGSPQGNDQFVSDFFGIPYAGTIGPVGGGFYALQTPEYITPWKSISVSPGQYTADDLALELQSKMNAAFPTAGFEVALIDPDRNPRFLFTSTSLLKYFSEYSTGGVSSLSRVLGISEDSQFNTSFTSQTTPNLRGLTVVSLQSRTLATARCAQAATPFLDEESLSISTVTEIPITAEWLGWQSYRPVLNQSVSYDNPISLTSISFTFRDATSPGGQLVEFSEPGAHILLEVVVS